ncbi:MAG: phosphate ABC transporter permease PstA [Candidatus Lambdaproteobacteria bacterium]|nr:phosphate ABC transporter permease PstA [Candidatus Lambdaproteobacteria bacterium]
MSLKQGEVYVWISGAAVTLTLLIAATLIVVVLVNGLGFYWPKDLVTVTLADGTRLLGEVLEHEPIPERGATRSLYKVGNRDLYGADFRWVDDADVRARERAPEAVALERAEFGNFYGFLAELRLAGLDAPPAADPWQRLEWARREVARRHEAIAQAQAALSVVNRRMQSLAGRIQTLRYQGAADDDALLAELEAQRASALAEFDRQNRPLLEQVATLRAHAVLLRDVAGTEQAVPLLDIVRAWRPNRMGLWAKAGFYAGKLGELFTGEPRESNTEGGLFPAIFGTVLLVIIMSLFSVPMGVVAAIYLHEYAREGWLVRVVRIAMYNLAGVPSIVFGIFGLGFFVYGVGAGVDALFFAERLPTPTFGTGGILWASLTLALLTVPVVVVATEEGLSSVPRGMREASLALGSTQLQTLLRVVMPMAAPGVVTGFILAMARAAGEVAPLMITGVVKLAPTLPIDGEFPFVHLDRKFMHLGFHIYDVGFQSPNVEAAKPMVYMTTLLLVLIVLILSIVGVYLRNSMRKRFQGAAF